MMITRISYDKTSAVCHGELEHVHWNAIKLCLQIAKGVYHEEAILLGLIHVYSHSHSIYMIHVIEGKLIQVI